MVISIYLYIYIYIYIYISIYLYLYLSISLYKLLCKYTYIYEVAPASGRLPPSKLR